MWFNPIFRCSITSWWDCALDTFVSMERGDYFGVAQPFGFSSGLRPQNASTWEVNAPRALVDSSIWFWDDLFGRGPIMNSVATWFGIKTDTATINYFYVGIALGVKGRFDNAYRTAANTIVQCGVWNSHRNVDAKRAAFERGFICTSSGYYDTYGPLFARLIYILNDMKSQEWLHTMVPNLAETGNYVDNFFDPSSRKQPEFFYPPGFIYLDSEVINSCDEEPVEGE